MNPQIELKQNKFGSYDIMIYFNNATDTEFSFDFLSKNKLDEKINEAAAKINEKSKKIKVRAVNILVSGIIVASIPFASMMNVFAADKYSMAYLYTGTPSQQVNYINRTNNALNTVSPSYFDLTADGNLKLNAVSTELVSAAHSKGMKVIPFLSNHWDRTSGVNALNNIENLSTQIADAIEKYNLDGVNIDIENVTEAHKNAYVELTKTLRQKIPSDKEVSVAVAANPSGWATGWHGSYDYTNLAKNSDYLMVMSYDEHWQGSEPGPVASISFVENSIKYGLSKTTKDKLVLGLPFYGRIWSSDNNFNGNGISLEQVSKLVSDYNATVTYDTASQSPKAVFTVNEGDSQNTVNSKKITPGTYTVWFENEQSFMKKMELINKYDIKGAGAWALGQETSSIWQNYSSWLSGNFNYSDSGILPPQEQESESNAEITTGIVTATTLNVRNTPSTSGGIITTLSKNSSVDILSTANGWHKIRLSNGQTGYVSADYIMLSSPVIPADPAPTQPDPVTPEVIPGVPETPPPVVTPDVPVVPDANTQTGTITGIVTATTLNVRNTPSTSGKVAATLKKNASVEILSTSNGWHNIRFSNGKTGYVSTKYIK